MFAPRLLIILPAVLSMVVVVRGDEPECQATRIVEAPPRHEEDAEVLAMCHLACLNATYSPAQLEVEISTGVQWPTYDQGRLVSNCILFRELMECTRGCIERMKNSSLSRGTCRDKCYADCNSECEGGCTSQHYYPNTECRRNSCSRQDCGPGCNAVYETLANPQGSRAPPPPSPLNPPTLTRPDGLQGTDYDAGIYQISYASSSDEEFTGGETAQAITAFVFRIERQSGNDSYHIVELSLDGTTLNLSYFACENVSVSFAAITVYGVSEYSPPTHVCVYGEGQFPSQPKTVSFTWKEDDRPNFTENVRIDVTWTRPLTGYSYMTHYTLKLFTDSEECGHSSEHENNASVFTFFGIARDLTMFEIAASEPDFAPILGCVYDLTLQANPVENQLTDFTQIAVDLTDFTPTAPVTSMHLECHEGIDKVSGKISVEAVWHINGTINVTEAIGSYSIYAVLVDASSDIPTLQEQIEEIIVNANTSGRGSYVVDDIEPRNQESYRIKITVYPIVKEGSKDRRALPDPRECTASARPERPDPVDSDNITIRNFQFENKNYNLSLSWELPHATYGEVTTIHVRILRKPAMSVDSVKDSDIAATEDLTTNETYAEVNGTIHGSEEAVCLYVQISISTQFEQMSVWSDSVALRRYPDLYPSCQSPPTTSPTVPLSPLPSQMPLYAYIILGIGICILITLVMLVVIWILYKQHRKKRQMRQVFDQSIRIPMTGSLGGHAEVGFKLSSKSLVDMWEIPSNKVIVEEELGEGCFGEVHKGIVMGPIPNSRLMNGAICVTVAIKFLKSSATGSERTDFLSEIETMKQIAKGNNPHVISLVGCVTVKEPLCLITEFVKHGDLLSYLQTIRKLVMQKNRERKLAQIAGVKQPEPYLEPVPLQTKLLSPDRDQPEGMEAGASDQVVKPSPDSPYAELGEIEPVNLISFAYQITSGMEYLSSLNIVHRDLACRNILVGENKYLKITDFGMARVVNGDDVYVKTSKGRMPWKWMAIESIGNREFTTASDVWSYGIVLWEIATLGGFPYPMIPNGELLEHLKRGFRMSTPENCRREIYKIMLDCWNEVPDERPTFTQLRGIFDSMLAENNPYIQFNNINNHQPYYNRMSSSEDDRTTGISSNTTSELPSSTSSSSVTLNGATASGYDYLKPLVGPVLDEKHGRPIPNPYVDTPTTKVSYDEEGYELDVQHIQRIEDEFEHIEQQLDAPDHTIITVL